MPESTLSLIRIEFEWGALTILSINVRSWLRVLWCVLSEFISTAKMKIANDSSIEINSFRQLWGLLLNHFLRIISHEHIYSRMTEDLDGLCWPNFLNHCGLSFRYGFFASTSMVRSNLSLIFPYFHDCWIILRDRMMWVRSLLVLNIRRWWALDNKFKDGVWLFLGPLILSNFWNYKYYSLSSLNLYSITTTKKISIVLANVNQSNYGVCYLHR